MNDKTKRAARVAGENLIYAVARTVERIAQLLSHFTPVRGAWLCRWTPDLSKAPPGRYFDAYRERSYMGSAVTVRAGAYELIVDLAG